MASDDTNGSCQPNHVTRANMPPQVGLVEAKARLRRAGCGREPFFGEGFGDGVEDTAVFEVPGMGDDLPG